MIARTPSQKQQFLEGKPPMVPSRWPQFVYPDGKGNTARPSEGLLQNQLLVDVSHSPFYIRTAIYHSAGRQSCPSVTILCYSISLGQAWDGETRAKGDWSKIPADPSHTCISSVHRRSREYLEFHSAHCQDLREWSRSALHGHPKTPSAMMAERSITLISTRSCASFWRHQGSVVVQRCCLSGGISKLKSEMH